MITTNKEHTKGKVSKSFSQSAKRMFYGTLVLAVGVASFAAVKANEIPAQALMPDGIVAVTEEANTPNDTNEVVDYLEFTNQVEDNYAAKVGTAVANLKNGNSTNVRGDYNEVVNFCLVTTKAQVIADKGLNIDDIDNMKILPNYNSGSEVPDYGIEFTDKVTGEKDYFNYSSNDQSPVFEMLGNVFAMQNTDPEKDSKQVYDLYNKFAKSLVTFQNYKDALATVSKNVK